MKIAVMSDIHGNYIALQRCLAHALEQNVDAYIFLGDYLGEFPYPQRTLEILYELRQNASCIFIRGNKEDYWLNRRKDQNCDWKNGNRSVMAMIYNYDNLNAKDLDFFEMLPISQSIRFDGMEPVLACHGTPFENQKALRSEDLFVQKCEERYIICGHTHMQGFVSDGKKKIINAGAVGVPLKSPKKTQYMILTSDGKDWKPEFLSLEYDVDTVIKEIYESGLWDASPYGAFAVYRGAAPRNGLKSCHETKRLSGSLVSYCGLLLGESTGRAGDKIGWNKLAGIVNFGLTKLRLRGIQIMVRKLQKADIDRVADIWLDTNLKAHDFISAQYWKRNFELVKEMLLQAEVYVYESDQKIQGFIGLNNDYIEGIFVSDKMQSQGIGKILLNDTKDKRNELRLNVYRKNTRAIFFYKREGFEIQSDGLDEATGERDYVMVWKKK